MARKTSTLKTLLGAGILLTALAPSSGCLWLFGDGYDGAYIESEDLSLEVPDQGFRAEGDQGDLYLLCNETADNTNSWVSSVVEVTGVVVEFLNNYRESSSEGAWRVYGPFDDNSSERDVAWMVKISGDAADTAFEFWVGPRGETDAAAFELLTEGSLSIEDEIRSGTMHIDFDTYENYPGLDYTLVWDYAGDITIDFERNVDSGEKTITIDYDNFVANRTGYLDDDSFQSDETYEYHLGGDKSGSFHLALMGEWDTWPWTWSGPMQERMQLDMVWNADQAGRAYGTITEVDGVGDMLHGDLELDECFDQSGGLSYRFLTQVYADEVPDYEYNFGEAETCVVEQPGA